jgi:hypothetical protein
MDEMQAFFKFCASPIRNRKIHIVRRQVSGNKVIQRKIVIVLTNKKSIKDWSYLWCAHSEKRKRAQARQHSIVLTIFTTNGKILFCPSQ